MSLKIQHRTAFWATLLVIIAALAGGLSGSSLSFEHAFEVKSRTHMVSLAVSLGMLCGVTLLVLSLLSFRRLSSSALFSLGCFTLIALLYLNLLREFVVFGDFVDYTNAAKAIRNQQPFSDRYIYPPFWASMLAQVQHAIGYHGSVFFVFALNQLSLAAFFFLGIAFLMKTGLSRVFASLLLTLALVVNVPVLRNMAYVQVNLLLIDLALGAVLIFARFPFFSALLLAVATHLKVLPLLFAPAFLDVKKWRWAFYFALTGIGIAGLTVYLDGYSYYQNFFDNLGGWKPTSTRAASFYVFLVRTNRHLGTDLPADLIYNVIRIAMALWIAYLAYRAVRTKTFADTGDAAADRAVNGLVPLLFLLPALSPAVWTRHLVVLIIPAALILLRVSTASGLAWWCAGYALTFLLPSFDWYPWSFLRLAGWIILLASLHRVITAEAKPAWSTSIDESISSGISKSLDSLRS